MTARIASGDGWTLTQFARPGGPWLQVDSNRLSDTWCVLDARAAFALAGSLAAWAADQGYRGQLDYVRPLGVPPVDPSGATPRLLVQLAGGRRIPHRYPKRGRTPRGLA